MANATTSFDYIIIGAGFAGAATAWHLAQRAAGSIAILEREEQAGIHASGRNAAIVRTLYADGHLTALAERGRLEIERFASRRVAGTGMQRCGCLLVGHDHHLKALDKATAGDRPLHLDIDACVARVPVLKGGDFDGGLLSANDGVVDAAGLLQYYLRGAMDAGARLACNSPVLAIDRPDGHTFRVTTPTETIHGRVLVNAAGAWAPAVAHLAGASPLPLTPYRRHLFIGMPDTSPDPAWPAVWNVTREFYFRPESGGLLLSPCDEDAWHPSIPEESAEAPGWLAAKIAQAAPELGSLRISHSWAGLRTISPDRRFIIGWDPVQEGFLWVAGLGGHGVTSSGAVGEIATDLLVGIDNPFAAAVTPRRFTTPKPNWRPTP